MKSNELLIHVKTEMNLQRITLSGKMPVPDCYILYGSIYLTLLNEKAMDMEKVDNSVWG